jgi:hypothetical protein
MPSVSSPARPVKARRRVNPARLTSCGCTSRPVYHCELLPAGQAGLVEINGEPYPGLCTAVARADVGASPNAWAKSTCGRA